MRPEVYEVLKDFWSADELKLKIIELNRILVSEDPVAAIKSTSIRVSGKATPAKESTNVHANSAVKLDASKIDTVLNLVGELVVLKSQMLQAFFSATLQHVDISMDFNVISNLDFDDLH